MADFDKTEKKNKTAWDVVKGIAKIIYKLRSFFLSIPVIIAAVALAMRNTRILPNSVGINLLPTGDYQWMVARNVAVLGPMAITAVCLLMMFCSRRVVYPWLISIFSLAIPLLIWVTNVFPA